MAVATFDDSRLTFDDPRVQFDGLITEILGEAVLYPRLVLFAKHTSVEVDERLPSGLMVEDSRTTVRVLSDSRHGDSLVVLGGQLAPA